MAPTAAEQQERRRVVEAVWHASPTGMSFQSDDGDDDCWWRKDLVSLGLRALWRKDAQGVAATLGSRRRQGRLPYEEAEWPHLGQVKNK